MAQKLNIENKVLTDKEIIKKTEAVAYKLNYELIAHSTSPTIYPSIEYWRPIERYKGKYLVSNLGRIKNDRGRIIKLQRSTNGYAIFAFNDCGKTTLYIHHLVMETFGPHKPAPNYQIDHIDGNKLNNTITNLEWVTPGENQSRAYKNGLKMPSGAKPVTQIDINTNQIIMFFNTITDARMVTGDSYNNIRLEQTMTKKGYRWELSIAS